MLKTLSDATTKFVSEVRVQIYGLGSVIQSTAGPNIILEHKTFLPVLIWHLEIKIVFWSLKKHKVSFSDVMEVRVSSASHLVDASQKVNGYHYNVGSDSFPQGGR